MSGSQMVMATAVHINRISRVAAKQHSLNQVGPAPDSAEKNPPKDIDDLLRDIDDSKSEDEKYNTNSLKKERVGDESGEAQTAKARSRAARLSRRGSTLTHSASKNETIAPKKFYIRVAIANVHNVDLINSCFEVQFGIFMSWRAFDERSPFYYKSFKELKEAKEAPVDPHSKVSKYPREEEWKEYWMPTIQFANSIDVRSGLEQNVFTPLEGHPDAFHDLPSVFPGGWVSLNTKPPGLRVIFRERFELATFPFDAQDFKITLIEAPAAGHFIGQFCNSEEQHVDNPSLPASVGNDTISELAADGLPEWELHYPIISECGKPVYETGHLNRPHAKFVVNLRMKRKPGFYIWNIVIPFGMIVTLSFASFAFSVWDRCDVRMQVAVTMLLSAVAFKFVAIQTLPSIPYLTLLDKYILVVFFLLRVQ